MNIIIIIILFLRVDKFPKKAEKEDRQRITRERVAVCPLRKAPSLTVSLVEGSYSDKDVGQTLSLPLYLLVRARLYMCVRA